MRTYTDAVQELACLERLRQRTEDAELARSLSLRLRGGVDTLVFLFEIERAEVEDDALAKRAGETAREEQLRMHIRQATGCPKQGEVACTHWGATSDIIKFASCDHTAYQWVNAGFVPRDDARWRMSNDYNAYYYCEWYDVRWIPERASELMETAPREVDRLPDGSPYNGKPWW